MRVCKNKYQKQFIYNLSDQKGSMKREEREKKGNSVAQVAKGTKETKRFGRERDNCGAQP